MRRLSALVGVLFCSHAATAQIPDNAQTKLAQSWAQYNSHAVCQKYGAHGEYIPQSMHYCAWPRSDGSILGVQFGLGGGPTLVNWERYARDAADANRITDSLNAALVKRGLTLQVCKPSDTPVKVNSRFWEGPGLVVQLMRTEPATGSPHITVEAMSPAVFTKIIRDLCLGTPRKP